MSAAIDRLSAKGRRASLVDVAAALGLTVEQVVEAIEDARVLEAAATAGGASPEAAERILQLRFVGRLTQSEIAMQLGMSQIEVSTVISRSLSRLPEPR